MKTFMDRTSIYSIYPQPKRFFLHVYYSYVQSYIDKIHYTSTITTKQALIIQF